MATTAGVRLAFEAGGSGSPTLLLLHGVGGNAGVWCNLRRHLASEWPGRWIAPDLRGHGRSFHCAPYSFGAHAADVAALLGSEERVICLGHSMGGVVGIALASGWFGVEVAQVVAIGVKIVWQSEEVAKAQNFARSAVRWFETRDEAVQRFLRATGLARLVDPDSECVARGIQECDGRFRLAMDPAANLAGDPIEPFIRAMSAPLRLAAGDRDPMVTLDEMRRYDPGATLIEGAGHNAHVEAPERVWALLEQEAGVSGSR
jgi:pimeloyl-ACP methyl ester carboxylesterase